MKEIEKIVDKILMKLKYTRKLRGSCWNMRTSKSNKWNQRVEFKEIRTYR
jgi:hypothetical protein